MSKTLADQVWELEGRLIVEALREHRGNLRQAALALGVSRAGLYRKAARLGIDPDRYRPQGAGDEIEDTVAEPKT